MKVPLTAFAALALTACAGSSAQRLSYDGVWGGQYWECLERARDREIKGPLPAEAIVDKAFERCAPKRPNAVRQLRAIIPSSSYSAGIEIELMRSKDERWRQSALTHIEQMRQIPGYWKSNASN